MDVNKIRRDFPLLQKKFDGKPFVYFDNACTTLRPKQVMEAMDDYYYNYPSCGTRSIHKLSHLVTIKVEETREKLARFINAGSPDEVVFTSNATSAINTVAKGYRLARGDVVIMTDKEHNSNLIPWQMLRDKIGIVIRQVKSKPDNTFDMEAFKETLGGAKGRAKLVTMVHSSNLDGYTIPARDICELAHDHGAIVMLDGAQSAPHFRADVKRDDVDFFALSIHKMCGPSGMGALYGKSELLDKMKPMLAGGGTVDDSTYEDFKITPPPKRFEGGLQNYAGIIGAGAAIDYLSKIGKQEFQAHELELSKALLSGLSGDKRIQVIGHKDPKLSSGIASFNIRGANPHDVAMVMDEHYNILLRSGMHCVHSWFNSHKVEGSVRVSAYIYNTKREVKYFTERAMECADNMAKARRR